ncbi:glycoside hydrolase family protein [Paenibacillus alvei A6-6i-x]|nr:glycoside hydrolase family protein [Paenibacillus alvei A6-6i-x]
MQKCKCARQFMLARFFILSNPMMQSEEVGVDYMRSNGVGRGAPHYRTGGKNRKKGKGGGCLFILIGLAILAASVWKGWDGIRDWLPGQNKADSQISQVEQPLIWDGSWTGYGTKGKGENLLIPVQALSDKFSIVYENSSETVIMTSSKDVASVALGHSTGSLNGRAKQWSAAAEQIGGDIYVPMTALKEVYGLRAKQYTSNGAVQLSTPGQTLQQGIVIQQKDDAQIALRENASNQAPSLEKLASGTQVTVWGEEGDWLRIEAEGGNVGYIAKDEIQRKGSVAVPSISPAPVPAFVKEKRPVSLAWEAVYSRNPDPTKLPAMPGTNVISPTWFSLADNEGSVDEKADPRLVQWAHQNGKQVWALYSNSFDPDRTTASLATFDKRNRTIAQLVKLAEKYNVDGINIDYENVNVEDRDNLTQFVRELAPRLHAKGLVASIDVTAKSGSGRWSQFLDREQLARSVDFMMVMAYDEHWATSPTAGSVASLPWTENAMKRIMEEDNVPPHKLVLGMPLYTRIWTETTEGGEVKVSSKAVGMQKVQDLIQDRKLKPVYSESAGQHYVEYEEEGATQKIWIEDKQSIQSRIQMAERLKLGGVAVWARSFANEGIWNVLRYRNS